MRHWFVAAFAKNEALFNQIQVKQIILKDSGGQQAKKKRENQGKKTVRIFGWNAPSSGVWHTILLKRSEFRPAELNFAFKALLILMTSISESMFVCF